MPRSMVVGLLAAIGAAMSAVIGLTHGDVFPVMTAGTAAAAGLAAYLAIEPSKKISGRAV
jgi:hypothetical protein